VLVATGLRDEIPAIPGLAERWGRDVLHCPYCHGYEVRNRPLGVLGGSPEAVQHALLIRQWSADVTFFAHTHDLSNDERRRLRARDIRVAEGVVTRLIIDGDRLAGVELDRASVVAPHALFVRPRPVPGDGLLTGLGAVLIEERTGRTTVPGVWAAGNAVDPRAQVITAAGAGSAAAIDINADLVEQDVRDALPFSVAQERRVAAVLNRSVL
jgi:thioredoxin reductase